jgi:aminopeptidase N
LRNTLNDESLDPAFRELMLTLPSEAMIAEAFDVVDPQAIHAARQFVRATITHHLKADLLHAYETHQTPGKYVPMLYRWQKSEKFGTFILTRMGR